MKRTVTILLIVILAVGFGWYLFKISGTPAPATDANLCEALKQALPAPLRDVSPYDHVLGNPQAKNTVVTFEDIQCPACASFEPVLRALPGGLKDSKVVFRHFPLASIHKNATQAALAAEAAAAQGKFWEWASLAYKNQSEWSEEKNPIDKFVELAKQAGVANLDQFKSEVESQKYKSKIEADIAEASTINVQGTPTVYFNNVQLKLAGLAGIKQQAECLYKE